ncbi:hypothetical protein OESDEN_01170 [Oesophagostomum dentatum]|uniref:Endonuclease/exonuclease/phosphatase domain-containing protein n=1 Tax=Oesophagostomum dentatum TaxID=61180 RepID=A0A0B1TNJ4_OESDE|nr:hypothetical protein OESDEN_01170 [Oesophagostomum dentatum]
MEAELKCENEEQAENKIGRFELGLRNENGNRLVGLFSTARLLHGNSTFIKKNTAGTWESPNGTTDAEIDHMLTNRRWCLLDVSVVPSFCCGSDHRLLRAKIFLNSLLPMHRRGQLLQRTSAPPHCDVDRNTEVYMPPVFFGGSPNKKVQRHCIEKVEASSSWPSVSLHNIECE